MPTKRRRKKRAILKPKRPPGRPRFEDRDERGREIGDIIIKLKALGFSEGRIVNEIRDRRLFSTGGWPIHRSTVRRVLARAAPQHPAITEQSPTSQEI
jgi:hypothetical protein